METIINYLSNKYDLKWKKVINWLGFECEYADFIEDDWRWDIRIVRGSHVEVSCRHLGSVVDASAVVHKNGYIEYHRSRSMLWLNPLIDEIELIMNGGAVV